MTKRLIALLTALMMLLTFAIAEEDEEEFEQAVIDVLIIPADETTGQAELGYTAETTILEDGGLKFKDLNKNDTLDVYEDWRKPAQERVADLLSQMNNEQKAFQMLHMTMLKLTESWFTDLNVGFVLDHNYMYESAEIAALKANEIQALSESAAFGIPVVISLDSVIGASWVKDGTIIPDQITLAATGNVELVRQLNIMQAEEMKAIGVRMSLSPVADIATDPRWGRAQECFGEDVELAMQMVVAAIEGLQGGAELTAESVMACVKHFPGSGPQTAGQDGSPLVFDEETLQMHLSIFQAAIDAGAASIMPYGYSTVPYLGGDAVGTFAHESKTVMDLLRSMGFEGIIQTDWGNNNTVAAMNGADGLGGAGKRETKKLMQNLTDEQFNEKVGRLLTAKFELGIFENPYVDAAHAAATVGSDAHYALAKQAAAEAMTLVKYENMTPLAGKKIIVAGSLAEDNVALSSNWKTEYYEGKTILTAIQEQAGAENVTYIGNDASQVAAEYDENTVAIVVIGEATGTHEPAWGSATLEFPQEQVEIMKALDASGVKIVTVAVMNRAYVMADMAEMSDAMLLAYRPGSAAGADAVAEALFGKTAITGKTPFQIPATMESVLLQREDRAKDIADPLFDYGFGIETESFGK